MDYVGGYVIFNDITARDIQRREMQSGVFSFCKAIDTFCPLGPWIVTPDEIPDPHDLAMELRVNGETRQRRTPARCPRRSRRSSATTRRSATRPATSSRPARSRGVAGFSQDAASLYLQPGDVVEAEIERIGVLRNPSSRGRTRTASRHRERFAGSTRASSSCARDAVGEVGESARSSCPTRYDWARIARPRPELVPRARVADPVHVRPRFATSDGTFARRTGGEARGPLAAGIAEFAGGHTSPP